MTLTTDFSSTCWLIAISCANMSDLDVSQSVHVDKMEELSKELATGCGVRLGKLVLCAQVWNSPSYETIRSEADEMFAKGTMNWDGSLQMADGWVKFVEIISRVNNFSMFLGQPAFYASRATAAFIWTELDGIVVRLLLDLCCIISSSNF